MERLLNVNEAAEILGESVESVYRYARQGVIPSVRLQRKVKFSASKLQDFFENGGTKNDQS